MSDNSQLQNKKAHIYHLTKEGEYSKAISQLKEMQQDDPFEAWPFRQHAFIALKKQRKFAEAAQVAEAGLKSNPSHTTLKRYWAEALSRIRGAEQEAEKLFNELQDTLTGNEKVKLLSVYADFLVRQGRIKSAQDIYGSMLEIKPEDHRARTGLARSHRIDKQYQQCLDILNENNSVEDPYWLKEKAHCLVEVGDGENAKLLLMSARKIALRKFTDKRQKSQFLKTITSLEKAAQALTDDWRSAIDWVIEQPKKGNLSVVWHSIRERLKRDNTFELGIKHLMQILHHQPKNLVVPYQLGQLLLLSKMSSEKNFEMINSLLKIAPENIDILAQAARSYQDDDIEKAETFWNKAWEIAKHEPVRQGFLQSITWVTYRYAEFLRQQDKYEEAYMAIEEARTKWGIRSWEIDLERAICLTKLADYAEAYRILERLNNRRPDNAVVMDRMGICLRSMGKLDEALAIFERKIQLYPKDQFGYRGFGLTLFALGRYAEAKKIFEDILAKNGDDIEAKWAIVLILQEQRDYEGAKKYIKDIDPQSLIERGRSHFYIEKKLAQLEKQHTEQLHELEEAKRLTYLGIMATAQAHELNQPIGIIRAATDAALADIDDGLFSPEEIEPLLNRILTQTDRLNAIINNFRKFARGDRIQREKVDLNELVEHTCTNFVEQFNHRHIRLAKKLWSKSPKPICWANSFQLEEVLINLLINARDAVEGRKDARILVQTFRRKGGVSGFSVEDNGPGLAPEYKDQMFIPYVSTKSTEKGTGLGLYISRRIVNDLGGRLRYVNESGDGACFIVELPPLSRRG